MKGKFERFPPFTTLYREGDEVLVIKSWEPLASHAELQIGARNQLFVRRARESKKQPPQKKLK